MECCLKPAQALMERRPLRMGTFLSIEASGCLAPWDPIAAMLRLTTNSSHIHRESSVETA